MIYFDNAASSFPKAPGVPEAMSDLLKNYGGNAGRASHKISIKLSELVFDVREKLTLFIGGLDSSKLIFTNNCSEAINTVLFGYLKEGMKVLVSGMEHNAAMRPLRYLEKEKKIILNFFGCSEQGADISDFERQLKKGIDAVVCSACSNVTGYIFPYRELAELAKKHGAVFILDAAQLLGKREMHIGDTAVDIICFPGHKGLLGPHGTGGFYINSDIKFNTLIYGGTGSVSESEYQPEFLPDKFESGTMNLCGIAGLNAALDYVNKITVAEIFRREKELADYLIAGLNNLKSIRIIGNHKNENCGIISILSEKKQICQIAQILDNNDIAVRMGLHCAPAAHRILGTFPNGTLRFSPGFFNKKSEIDFTIELFRDAGL
ncbi:MAG TPA: aminotransferase class V-fold PLP-dependent enzyme [bacterium]|nr:aminotransferase class V-fold PLP-dependent enzyme [bacterium]HPN32407.1 aminotransferase class V-fold PLP-dependent enzyme [bacterium]